MPVRAFGRVVAVSLGTARSGALRGAAEEVWIYGDAPGLEQPFWNVHPIPVLCAPVVQLCRI